MRLLVIAALSLGSVVGSAAMAQSAHEVRGYQRANGTYIAPHLQTNPDGTTLNNWSTRGNVNPSTGHSGTADPYKPAPSSLQPYNPYKTR